MINALEGQAAYHDDKGSCICQTICISSLYIHLVTQCGSLEHVMKKKGREMFMSCIYDLHDSRCFLNTLKVAA
jgi:hypothetical protein